MRSVFLSFNGFVGLRYVDLSTAGFEWYERRESPYTVIYSQAFIN